MNKEFYGGIIMIIKSAKNVLVCLIGLGFTILPCLAAEPIDQTKVAEVAGSIQQNLDPLLTGVNEHKRPNKTELAAWQKFLTESRRYFTKMDSKQQSQFLLLESWVSYFSGNIEQAHKNAVFAWNKDQTSGDALVTQITMALLVNKRPMLPKPPKPQKNKPAPGQDQMGAPGMPGMPGMPMDPGMQDTTGMLQPGKLTFDYKTLLVSALGKKLDPQNLNCLNGSTFVYQPGQEAACILAWRYYEAGAVRDEPNSETESSGEGMGVMPVGMPGMPGMPGMADSYGQADGGNAMAAFSQLFRMGLSTGEIKFLGLNLDSADRKEDVVSEMIKSPSPWAIVMAEEQKQKPSINGDIDKMPANKPILVMVDKAGEIRYAGPVTGFIPSMLMSQLTSVEFKNTPAESAPAAVDSNAQSAVESVPQPAPSGEQAAAQPTQFREMSEEEEIRAEQLLGPTRDLFMKTGRKHVTSYKNGVEMCRKVMRDFPGTKYAYQAQMLLRQVPENQRERYGITDQELGL